MVDPLALTNPIYHVHSIPHGIGCCMSLFTGILGSIDAAQWFCDQQQKSKLSPASELKFLLQLYSLWMDEIFVFGLGFLILGMRTLMQKPMKTHEIFLYSIGLGVGLNYRFGLGLWRWLVLGLGQ